MATERGAMEGVVSQFWAGKKVFITGHTGFKGSWLALWLQQLGAHVSGYALEPPTTPSLYHCARVEAGMSSTMGDIRNLPALQEAMHSFAPDIVFHLAAQSLVRLSYQSPLETFSTNVIGTANVLECIRQSPSVRAGIIVTSDKCYENKEWYWPYREIDALGGYDPYSASKACAELVASCYRSSYFSQANSAAVATARAGNVIGGGDWAIDRLVPDVTSSFGAGQSVRIRHPKALRPWQHVLEPLRGYLLLAQQLFEHGESFEGAWNFGPSRDSVKPVEWIVAWLSKQWSPEGRWEIDQAEQPHEAAILTLDSSKALAHLAWAPRLQLTQALKMTADWYQAFSRDEDMHLACVQQISDYDSHGGS